MGEKAEHIREFGTCFFEKYAQIVLATVLGPSFEELVNRDRPDLQSQTGRSLGIEVTRAMEESKAAGLALMQDIAGLTRGLPADDRDTILESGYSFGLRTGKYVGVRELPYWRMALPMRRILESKVSKAASGFYGHWDRLGLFVFSKDNLSEGDASKNTRNSAMTAYTSPISTISSSAISTTASRLPHVSPATASPRTSAAPSSSKPSAGSRRGKFSRKLLYL